MGKKHKASMKQGASERIRQSKHENLNYLLPSGKTNTPHFFTRQLGHLEKDGFILQSDDITQDFLKICE
jgi:hypothetical protein